MRTWMITVVCILFMVSISGLHGKREPGDNLVSVVSSSEDETVLRFEINSFDFKKVRTPHGHARVILANHGLKIKKEGAPDLVYFTVPVFIPVSANMVVEVMDAEYVEISGIDIAPWTGAGSREIDRLSPQNCYGDEYRTNAFFPEKLSDLPIPGFPGKKGEYIVQLNPFRYNPVTRVLRVYTRVTVRVGNAVRQGGIYPLFRLTDQRIDCSNF